MRADAIILLHLALSASTYSTSARCVRVCWHGRACVYARAYVARIHQYRLSTYSKYLGLASVSNTMELILVHRESSSLVPRPSKKAWGQG